MQITLDYLIAHQMVQELDNLMGHNLPWHQTETKSQIKYFKLD
tara:strand:- start:281 stop:409 length:129 start_codon:yes stop_codon:yes gene_type:complete